MPGRRTLIALMLLATLLADAAAVTICRSVDAQEIVARVALLALATSQVGLASAWFILAGRPLARRGAAVAAVVGAWAGLVGVAGFPRPPGVYLWLLTLQAAGVILAGTFLRVAGISIVAAGPGSEDHVAAPWQFSVGTMLGWMTLLAACLGVARYTLTELGGDLHSMVNLNGLLLFAVRSAVVFLAIWLVLAKRLPDRLPVWTVAIAAAGLVLTNGLFIISSDGHEQFAFVGHAVIEFVLLGASLGVLRVAGYRLVRHRRQRGESAI